MSAPLLWIVSAIYFGVAIDFGYRDNPGMCIAFLAYAVANIGLIVASR